MRQLKITKSITNRESASLDKYLQEIGREDLITVEEEVELAQRIRKGDRVALEKLTRANLRFVVSVAKQYMVPPSSISHTIAKLEKELGTQLFARNGNKISLNDYGRTYRTYQFYRDLCDTVGIEAEYGIYDLGTKFPGCLFENRSNGKPLIGVDYLMEE